MFHVDLEESPLLLNGELVAKVLFDRPGTSEGRSSSFVGPSEGQHTLETRRQKSRDQLRRIGDETSESLLVADRAGREVDPTNPISERFPILVTEETAHVRSAPGLGGEPRAES